MPTKSNAAPQGFTVEEMEGQLGLAAEHCKHLLAENERLRGALEALHQGLSSSGSWDRPVRDAACEKIRAALGGAR